LGPGREITLIENEVIEFIKKSLSIDLKPSETRRNILTKGIKLNDLVGKKFIIGNVLIKGMRPCHPCKHLDEISGKNMLKPLKNKGGLRADILDNGIIKIGDEIKVPKTL